MFRYSYAGSCFGRALALSFGDSFQLNVTVYAIIGASAMLCGVVRVVISLTIIVLVESTGLPLMIAPLIISNIAAHSMGNKISKKSIYEKLLELKDIPPPHSSRRNRLRYLPIECFTREI